MAACNQTLADNTELCTLDTCCLAQGFLSYRPTPVGNSVYLGIFALLLVLQVALGIRYRTWVFMGLQAAGCFLEILGYVGRLLLYNNPFLLSNFLLYLIPITIGPAFLSAAIYLTLGRTIVTYGLRFSAFQPRTYIDIFVTFDFICLALQAIGGAITSSAETSATRDKGVDIMIAGLSFQVFSLFAFMVACAYLAWNIWTRKDIPRTERFADLRPLKRYRLHLLAIAVATVTIFVRCCFRVAELQAGFDGSLANNEVLFMILEGPMIMIALIALTIWHPGYAYNGRYVETTCAYKRKITQEEIEGFNVGRKEDATSDSGGEDGQIKA